MNVISFHVEENLVGGIVGQLLYKNGINVINNNDLGSYRELQSTATKNVTVGSRYRSRSQRPQGKSLKRRIPRRLITDNPIKLRYIIANQQEVINKISITEDGTLLTLTGLDREEKDRYDLTVIVEYTTGMMSGAGIYQVHIHVDDVNDNAPKFNARSYVGLITENSPKGTVVSLSQSILITDADLGKNAEFRVALQGDYSDLFTVEYFNGSANVLNSTQLSADSSSVLNIFNLTEQWNEEFKFVELQADLMQSSAKSNTGPHFRIVYNGKKSLDREKDQMYALKILAVDTGGLTAYANLNILIQDLNDNAPIFERISVFKDSKVEIREYTTDMEIYFVESSAMPMDAMLASVVLPPYHIPGSPRVGMEMPIFNSSVPGAAISSYARSRQKSRGRSRMRLSRAISNTKCPLFAIQEDIALNTKVLQVTASDDDYGKNAQIHYEITGELVERPLGFQLSPKMQGAHHFVIDKLNGELLVNYPLAANIELFLNLSATDIDGLKDTTCLRFTVIDVNNHAPTFKKTWYSFDTEEGDYKNNVLGQVLAVDFDYGANANITYSLSSMDLPFKIKPYSGVLKIEGLLDREVKDKYNFQVIATDNAEPLYRMSSSVDVEVNILDINDNKPEFIGYDEMIKASKFINDLADKNQMLPLYKAYLDRSTKPGMFVKQLTAIDKDYVGNGNGLVLYSILHQDIHSPIFRIDSRDGTISTVASFRSYNDYEHLNVTVVASDLGSPALSSTAIVLINLQGQAVTEPTPQIETTTKQLELTQNLTLFQHQYYEIELLENNLAPTELLKLNLTQDVNMENYRYTLLLEDDDDLLPNQQASFVFNSKTATLHALVSFDREQKDRYQLRLRAEKPLRGARNFAKLAYPIVDERIQGLEAHECRIVLHILDENDNEPRFKGNGQPIIAVVPQSANFGYPITLVEATDADKGINAEIRYKLLNEPSKLFGIDEISGKIRLVALLPPNERVYGFDVKAADRAGADDGHSSIINVFVYVINESKQVRIVIAGKPVEVERKIDTLLRVLSDAIGAEVRVRLLEPHVGGVEPA